MIRALRRFIARRRTAELEAQRAICWRAWCEAKRRGDTRAQSDAHKAFRLATAEAIKAEIGR